MENDLKGNDNYFELMGGLSYRGFELPGVDCMYELLKESESSDCSLLHTSLN